MDKLLKILSEARPDIDFLAEDRLIDDRLLDSLDIVTIIGEINFEFDIEIGVEELIPENFNSAAAMWKLITEMR